MKYSAFEASKSHLFRICILYFILKTIKVSHYHPDRHMVMTLDHDQKKKGKM